ncbi:MAG: tyrosine-type recombinase/integrase [Bacteroidota bacterium]
MAKKASKKPVRRIRAIFRKTFAYADDGHPMVTYLEALGEASQRPMRVALESIADIFSNGKVDAEMLAWHQLRPEHTAKLRGRLQTLYAPATANRYLSALRGILKAAWRLEYVDRDTMERTLDIAPVRGRRALSGRGLAKTELAAVFEACQTDENIAAGARDGAILALLYGGGLRRTEVVTLDIDDVDLERKSVRVVGKGDKERVVFVPAGVIELVDVWLGHRGRQESGALFWHVGRTGCVRPRRISAELVYQIVLKRHQHAEVDRFTPHDLRRSYISDLLDEGVDLVVASKQVGHSNVATTARYDRRTERAQQDAAARLKLPTL